METTSFQVIDIRDFDEDDPEDSEEEQYNKSYIVRFFGRTLVTDDKHPDKSICVSFTGFQPYFYLRIPPTFNTHQLLKWFEKGRRINDITISEPFLSKDFDGFRNDEPSRFVKIESKSLARMKKASKSISNSQKMEIEVWVTNNMNDDAIRSKCKNMFRDIRINNITIGEPPIGQEECNRLVRIKFETVEDYQKGVQKSLCMSIPPDCIEFENEMRMNPAYKLYESNIEPILRFMHHTGIRGNSWLKIPTVAIDTSNNTLCDLEARLNWLHASPDEEKNKDAVSARFRVMSYDIETMSSDPEGSFPQASRENDVIMQIGIAFNYYHHPECYKKYLISLKQCDDINDVIVKSFEDEKDVLDCFSEILKQEDPDILVGYNTFGFDNPYMRDRSVLCGNAIDFSKWGRLNEPCKFKEKKLSSSALGDNFLKYYDSPGRVQVDLFKVIQRDHNLASYRLDYVSSHFNQNKMTKLEDNYFITDSTDGLEEGGFFAVKVIEEDSCGIEDELPGKYKVTKIEGNRVEFLGGPLQIGENVRTIFWSMVKDDISAKDMFRMWPQGSSERAIIGKYCIKDCILVNYLMEKLSVLANNFQMANVCFIPIPYVFLRGQGIKGFSLVSEECMKAGYLIPVVQKEDFVNNIWKGDPDDRIQSWGKKDTECSYDGCGAKGRLALYKDNVIICEVCKRIQYDASYKGARVIDPKPGRYRDPVCCLDFASLYPRSILARNISWETAIQDPKYMNLEGFNYHEIEYETTNGDKVKCHFAQKKDGSLGMIPKILTKLLDARAETRKILKKTTCPFKRKILDGAQLSFKLSSNSIYGINGAPTSPLYKKSIAACTTATGREMLYRAQVFVEEEFMPYINALDENHWTKQYIDSLKPKVVYGDTDSVFVDFGYPASLDSRSKVELAIQYGKLAEEVLNTRLPHPEEIEYEKCYMPWIILSKKRYAGMKYEMDPDKGKFHFMGLSLKRRDSSLIVKKVLGGIVHRLMTEATNENVIEYVKTMLHDIAEGNYNDRMFVLSKKLKNTYANPDSIAHVALAKRMAERNPGSAPASGDRISYFTVYKKELLGKKVLQSQRVEDVDYVRENNIPIDYAFYISNQIQVPVCQFLKLIIKNPEDTIFKPLLKKIDNKRQYLANKKTADRFISYFKKTNVT